jgi:hypothetical protein
LLRRYNEKSKSKILQLRLKIGGKIEGKKMRSSKGSVKNTEILMGFLPRLTANAILPQRKRLRGKRFRNRNFPRRIRWQNL